MQARRTHEGDFGTNVLSAWNGSLVERDAVDGGHAL